MGFTGAHVLYTFDVFILALYLLSHGCALLKYTCKPHKQVYISYNTNVNTLLHKFKYPINQVYAPPEWVGEHHYNGEALSVWELGTQHIFLNVQKL